MLHLADFPKLYSWYSQTRSEQIQNVAEKAVWMTCFNLQKEPPAPPEACLAPICHLLNAADEAPHLFAEFFNFMVSMDADFEQMASKIAEQAASLSHTKPIQQLSMIGERTGRSTFNFLSAWLALNNDLPDICVEEAEKIDRPVAPLLTIQGQALLELGQAHRAIDALKLATNIEPKEILAWFQLAKAYHVTDDHDLAFMALRECRKIAPECQEIAVFMTLVAISENHPDKAKIGESWDYMQRFAAQESDNPDFIKAMMDLAFKNGQEHQVQWVLNNFSISSAFGKPQGVPLLPTILRAFQSKQWFELAADFLSKINPPESHS